MASLFWKSSAACANAERSPLWKTLPLSSLKLHLRTQIQFLPGHQITRVKAVSLVSAVKLKSLKKKCFLWNWDVYIWFWWQEREWSPYMLRNTFHSFTSRLLWTWKCMSCKQSIRYIYLKLCLGEVRLCLLWIHVFPKIGYLCISTCQLTGSLTPEIVCQCKVTPVLYVCQQITKRAEINFPFHL